MVRRPLTLKGSFFAEGADRWWLLVLVDKPVTATYAQAAELDALAKAKQRVLYPYQNRRWDSDFLALKSLLSLPHTDPNSLGTLWEFESRCVFHLLVCRGMLTVCVASIATARRSRAHGRTSRCPRAASCSISPHTPSTRPSSSLAGRRRSPRRLRTSGGWAILMSTIPYVPPPQPPRFFLLTILQFTITLRYPPRPAPAGEVQPTSFTVILRGAILSVKSPQVRYVVRGTQGTYSKFGVDLQEDQLKAIKAPSDIFQSEAYGAEPEELWGILENQRGNDVVRSVYVPRKLGMWMLWLMHEYDVGGLRRRRASTLGCSGTSRRRSARDLSRRSSSRSRRR